MRTCVWNLSINEKVFDICELSTGGKGVETYGFQKPTRQPVQQKMSSTFSKKDSVSKNKVECVKGRVNINLWPTWCIYGPTH